jgi:putative SOS response-associated peptidase YedK
VLAEGGKRRLEVLGWGLIPPWADDPQIGSRMINACAETEKPSFRRAFYERRCLIPADGFYGWKRTNGSKQPYYIHMKQKHPFAFAGLQESWNDNDGPAIWSCTILTTGPDTLVGEIHDRMPVILPAGSYDAWLDPEAGRDELAALLAPYPEDEMEAYPVSRFVNSPLNNDPRCVEPAA